MQLVAEVKNGVALRKPKSGLIINKIKIKHGKDFKLTLIQELPRVDKEDKKLISNYAEQPRKEFDHALSLILDTLIIDLGLNLDKWQDGKISEISLKETDEGIDAVIIALLEITDDKKATAKLTEKNISYELKSKIDNFLAEVEDYINGKRAQMSLFDEQ